MQIINKTNELLDEIIKRLSVLENEVNVLKNNNINQSYQTIGVDLWNEQRIDTIGQNGNDGLHYIELNGDIK